MFSIKSGDLPNKEFSISRDGDLVLDKALDFETQTLFSFYVIVTDGVTNDEAEVSIRVLNVNDWNPEFRYPEYEFFVTDNRYNSFLVIDKPEAKSQSKAQSPKKPQKGKRGIWPLG